MAYVKKTVQELREGKGTAHELIKAKACKANTAAASTITTTIY
jgi:hypothetical protein